MAERLNRQRLRCTKHAAVHKEYNVAINQMNRKKQHSYVIDAATMVQSLSALASPFLAAPAAAAVAFFGHSRLR